MRSYAVLLEVPGDSHYGDLLFAYLGVYEARTAHGARREARREHGLDAATELTTVATHYWTTDEDRGA